MHHAYPKGIINYHRVDILYKCIMTTTGQYRLKHYAAHKELISRLYAILGLTPPPLTLQVPLTTQRPLYMYKALVTVLIHPYYRYIP